MNAECAFATTPSPQALLRGAEAARSSHKSIVARFDFEQTSPKPAAKFNCLVEVDGLKRRFETFSSAGYSGGVVLVLNDEEVHSFARDKYADVRLSDMKYVVNTAGDLAFDPRILGLSDLLTADTTLKECIWYQNVKSLEVLGKEKINGVDAWRVRAKSNGATSDYWIEEPGFRIHQRSIQWGNYETIIKSEFAENDTATPFPSRVEIVRKDNNGLLERRITVNSVEVDTNIAPDRFTLSSMNLPLNTMIVDYRIQRLAGYWDGKGISESPADPVEDPKKSEELLQSGARVWFFGVNLLIICLLVALIIRGKRRFT